MGAFEIFWRNRVPGNVEGVRKVRKSVVVALLLLLCLTAIGLGTWKIMDARNDGGDGEGKASSAATMPDGNNQETGSVENPGNAGEGEVESSAVSGEDFSMETPEQRYVVETQRHQNFFKALAEGKIKRLDAIATEYQPAGDPNTSYLYFTITTVDGKKSNGTMVLKFEGGKWRIAAVRQLEGELGGGTNYPVPASFEADLARELNELQEFLTKVAQGRLDYMVVDKVIKTSDRQTVLEGKVVGIGGRVEKAKMVLNKDYEIWHLSSIQPM